MTLFSLLAQGASLGFTATVAPGPFLAYTITQTLARGWRHTVSLMFAPLLSDLPIILIAVLILGQLPAEALRFIQIAGGVFVLWLAWGMARSLRAGTALVLTADGAPAPKRNILLHGAAINFFGPGAWIFWSTVNGPIVVQAWRESPVLALAFMLSFYAVLVLGIGAWIAVFHQARRLDERLIRGLMALSVVIMLVFGVTLLRAGLGG
jgi:threonine/homoserine/homoserine lactone efflux protein